MFLQIINLQIIFLFIDLLLKYIFLLNLLKIKRKQTFEIFKKNIERKKVMIKWRYRVTN